MEKLNLYDKQLLDIISLAVNTVCNQKDFISPRYSIDSEGKTHYEISPCQLELMNILNKSMDLPTSAKITELVTSHLSAIRLGVLLNK